VYVLPRVCVSIEKCQLELQALMQKNKINQFKFKTCRKYYAFDKHIGPSQTEQIPYESEYIQVEYNTTSNSNNSNNNLLFGDSGGDTYSCVFGQQQAYLEQFLIELKIKGPCWLQVNKSVQNQATLSWSKLEYSIDNYKNNISLYRDMHMPDRPDLAIPNTPPLNILTLLTRTMLNTKTQEHEIICACGLVSNKLYLGNKN
jgi:DNA polymerase alpha subunit A